MGDLVVLLLPEMLGLVVTPAAVVACFLLLGSRQPMRNVATFAAAFLGCYLLISVVAIGAGRAAGATEESSAAVRGVVSTTVGVLFLAGAVVLWLRRHQERPGPPAWVGRMRDPSPRLLLTFGAALSLINPNIAILASGLGMVLASDVDEAGQVLGVALLLASSAVDFVVPTLLFVLAGERGRRALAGFSDWLVTHDRVIGIAVLIAFGALFVVRGLGQLG